MSCIPVTHARLVIDERFYRFETGRNPAMAVLKSSVRIVEPQWQN
jgi:hypothetical protein